ncbi:MAG: hypothetical protein V3S14_16590 [Anaerolineae bacterium]
MPGEMCRNCAICGLGRPRFARRKISISRSESVEFGLDEQVEQQHVRACPAQQCSHISAAPRLGHQLDAGSLIQQCAQGDGDVWMVIYNGDMDHVHPFVNDRYANVILLRTSEKVNSNYLP